MKMMEYRSQIKYKYVTLISSNYPEYLKTVNCPPMVLFYKGNLKLMDKDPQELRVLASKKRFICNLDLISQNGHIAFDYVVCAESQNALDGLIEHMEKQGQPLKDSNKTKKRQKER